MTNDSALSYLILRGKVGSLRKQATKINPLQASVESEVAGWSAIAQAAANLPGAISSAELADYEGDPVEIFSMAISDQPVVGYLWRVGFVEGDEVEVAGSMEGHTFNAVAVRKAPERLIWLRPHYTMGSRALKKNDAARIFKFCLILNAIVLVSFPVGALFVAKGGESWSALFAMLLAACAMFDVTCAFILRTPGRLNFGKQVDAIGRAFKMDEPELLDFDKTYSAARAAGKPYISGGKYY